MTRECHWCGQDTTENDGYCSDMCRSLRAELDLDFRVSESAHAEQWGGA